MDSKHPLNYSRDKVEEKHREETTTTTTMLKQQGKDPPPPPNPPSASSSPTHEFSFTISLHNPPQAPPSSTPSADNDNNITKQIPSTPSSFAIDLSPADDIFFHGHLLPLHLLSHLPVSPRSSTNSLDSFTLPIKELLQDHHHHQQPVSSNSSTNSNTTCEPKPRPKSKSFSLFRLTRFRKGFEEEKLQDKEKQKRKLRFDLSQVLKRYARLVQTISLFRGRGRRRENVQLRGHGQTYSSYSGNLAVRNKHDLRGRRGEFSAPASMRTSPTNSGLLLATSGVSQSSNNDSTMEELQAAIQAAIAHCKNSIAVEEKLKAT